MIYVDADFETLSFCDLKVCGAWKYSQDPTTCVMVFRYEIDGHKYEWRPGDDITYLAKLISNPYVIFVAHNAGFEQPIWANIMVPEFGFPHIPVERWEDTQATAAWKAVPLGLDKLSKALHIPHEKDKEGNRLTLSMSRIDKKTGEAPTLTQEKLDRISQYCAQDVVVETAVRHRIGLLSEQSPQERRVWIYDQTINQRGVRVDLDFVHAAELVIARATAPLLAEFRSLTGGVNPGQVAGVKAWAAAQGVELENLQKGYLAELLGAEEEDDGYGSNAAEDDVGEAAGMGLAGLPGSVRQALYIRQMLGSASVKKLSRMRACAGEDGRVRGLLQYHAAGTGRWGGRLLQPQNFPRGVGLVHSDGVKASIDELVAAVLSGDPAECAKFFKKLDSGKVVPVEPIEMISSCLRHALVADPGKTFLVGDYAGIEARIVLALAGQYDKTALLAAGHDVYLDMASTIYGDPVLKGDPRRQYGKNGVLGCGFQCGPANFNVKFLGGENLPLAEQTVEAYRKEWAPKVPTLWYALGDAALSAARGKPKEVYGTRYELEDGWLTARLPSGWQKLWYYAPQVELDERFGRECWTYSTYKGGRHRRTKAYGGILTENTVQALARGLLCAAIDRLERAGLPVVLSVHDELICEVPEGAADQAAFEQLMAEPTSWAEDLRIPVAVEAWQGERYRK